MKLKDEIAIDIRATIGVCENYHILKDAQHQTLLQKASLFLLKETIAEARLDHQRKISVLGPETMGVIMVRSIQTAAQDSFLPKMTSVSFRSLLKESGRPGEFFWNKKPDTALKDSQIIWMDDVLRRGTVFEQTLPLLNEIGAQVAAIATLRDMNTVTASDLGVRHICTIERDWKE